jgi:hypothetical protein
MDTLAYNMGYKPEGYADCLEEIECFEEWLKTLPPKGHLMGGDWVDDNGDSLINV